MEESIELMEESIELVDVAGVDKLKELEGSGLTITNIFKSERGDPRLYTFKDSSLYLSIYLKRKFGSV